MSIVARDRWCPIPARTAPPGFALPLPEVWLHHGAAGTSSVGTAVGYARYHIETKGWGEVGYSFLIAAGTVLEGRGAGRQGAHTYGRNNVSHGIVLCGDYTSRQPAPEDLDAMAWLLQHGYQRGWWPSPAFTGGHRDAPGASTSCPGDRLHAAIPTINRNAQEDPMTDDDRALLQQVDGKLDQLLARLGARYTDDPSDSIGNDLRRARLDLRYLVTDAGGEPHS